MAAYARPSPQRYQQYDSSVDLWSVGAILYEMVCGRPPFTGQNPRHLLHNIDRHEAVVPASLRGNLSPQCQDMIRRLLRRRPAERIPWPDFFAHPFLASEAECPASPDTPAVAESELQREISQVARQIDCARLTREVTAACPSAVEIRRHHEYVSRREAEESASPRGAGPGGEHLLGGDYVVVDEGGAGEAAGAQGEEEADVGVDGGSGVGRMRRVMLHGLPGHLSEPSTLLRLPIAVEDGMEEEHLGARLHNLQCSAGAVWECARDVAALGNWFEAVVSLGPRSMPAGNCSHRSRPPRLVRMLWRHQECAVAPDVLACAPAEPDAALSDHTGDGAQAGQVGASGDSRPSGDGKHLF